MSVAAPKLRYLIGLDADPGEAWAVTELGYDAATPPKGMCIKYGNLRDQVSPEEMRKRGTGYYGPYLDLDDDIQRKYDEPAPDPNGEGFDRLVDEQLDADARDGWTEKEWDNADTFDSEVYLGVINKTAARGILTALKNPNLVEGDQLALIRHHAASRMIIEQDDDVTAGVLDKLRRDGGKPDLPIHVVTHGDQRPWAQQIANQAIALGLKNFSVTHSPGGEYTAVDHIMLPASEDKPMAWRPAKSLVTLRDQVNAKWPNRDKSSDGTIGDAAHQNTTSDHNPNSAGVVTAMDITHDPAHGLDARKLAETLVASRDQRIKYIISNGQIISSVVSPWQWRTYTGANAHRQHVHISVIGSAGLYDDPREWNLGAAPVPVPGRNMGITATRFQDSEVAYADVAPGWNSRMGVSLPFRFKGERPKVRVFKGGKSIVCEIMDIGPWYDGTAERGPFDPYWETGSRPRAESDPKTNGAGIDLTFPADAALGLDGKGLVDWEFVTAEPPPPPPPPPADSVAVALARVEALHLEQQAALAALKEAIRMAPQPTPTPLNAEDVLKIVQEYLNRQQPAAPVTLVGMTPATGAAPPSQRPSVQASVAALIAVLIGQYFGVVPGGFGIGDNPTDLGTAAVATPALTAVAGYFGGWERVLQVLQFLGRAIQPKPVTK